MKRIVKNSIMIFSVLVLTIASILALAKLCRLKDIPDKYDEFFEQEENFDVLFYGNSHILDAVSPFKLWEDYGIVSYNLGFGASTVATTYWTMVNSLEYTNPKLAVLDVYGVDRPFKVESESFVHMALDGYPLSKAKIDAAEDLFPDDFNKQFQFLSSFSLYHSRWSELNSRDFKDGFFPVLYRGGTRVVNVAKPDEWTLLPKGEYEFNETVGTEYLRKFIEYCQQREIQVLLIKIPYPAMDGQFDFIDQRYGNAVQQIADEYNVEYINFFYDHSDLIDFDTDLADSNSHLNPSGGGKLTSFLGNHIRSQYDIPDRREDPTYEFWNVDYQDYYEYKRNFLDQQDRLYNYLMLLYDADFYSEIQIDSATRVDEQNEETGKLLNNIKDFTDISYVDDLKYNDNKCDILIRVYDAKTHEEVNTGAFNYAPSYNGNSARIS